MIAAKFFVSGEKNNRISGIWGDLGRRFGYLLGSCSPGILPRIYNKSWGLRLYDVLHYEF